MCGSPRILGQVKAHRGTAFFRKDDAYDLAQASCTPSPPILGDDVPVVMVNVQHHRSGSCDDACRPAVGMVALTELPPAPSPVPARFTSSCAVPEMKEMLAASSWSADVEHHSQKSHHYARR